MKQTYSVKTIKNSGFYVLHKLDVGEIHENDPYFARELEEALEMSILRQSKKRKDTNQQQSDSEKLSVEEKYPLEEEPCRDSTPSNQPRARYWSLEQTIRTILSFILISSFLHLCRLLFTPGLDYHHFPRLSHASALVQLP
jgi:hypothetical protein